MVFSKRIAKLGKASIVNMSAKKDNSYNVFLSNKVVEQKQLDVINTTFLLSPLICTHNYSEIVPLSGDYVLARIASDISIIKLGENGG